MVQKRYAWARPPLHPSRHVPHSAFRSCRANPPTRPPPLCRRPSRRRAPRSEEHTSELQSLMRISYAVFCLKKKKRKTTNKRLTIYLHVSHNNTSKNSQL